MSTAFSKIALSGQIVLVDSNDQGLTKRSPICKRVKIISQWNLILFFVKQQTAADREDEKDPRREVTETDGKATQNVEVPYVI